MEIDPTCPTCPISLKTIKQFKLSCLVLSLDKDSIALAKKSIQIKRYICFTLCYFVLVFLSPFSTAITPLGEERANLSALRTFVRFALVWFCLVPLPLGVWEGLRLVTVTLPGFFSYLFLISQRSSML